MGFIEDRVGPKGYNALAKRLLAGGRWPDPIEPRALGNALRELDQGRRRKWIADEDGARLHVLADALTLSPAELRDLLADHAAAPTGNLVPLVDLPMARPIDLAREPLFPGIPEEVLSPAHWSGPLWWEAAGGAGRTLVGRWLEARGLARFVRARDATGALEQIGPGLPLYVELDRPDQLDQLRRERLPPDLKICVTAPFAQPGAPTSAEKTERGRRGRTVWLSPLSKDELEVEPPKDRGWTRVAVPPLHTWAGPLLAWVARRLDASTGFDAREALVVVEQLKPWLRTPGDVLTLCGLIDHWGATTVGSGDEKALLHAAELAFQRMPEGNPFRDLLTENGAATALLLGFVQHTFRLSAQAIEMDDLLERGLSREGWTQLVPASLAPTPDVDAARELARAARQHGTPLDPVVLDAVLQPGPAVLIDGLLEGHLLESQGEGRLVFRMRWLLRWVEQHHLTEFAAWTAADIGDALLHPKAWRVVQARLLDGILDDDWSPIQRAVSEWRISEPAMVALLEGAFLATGLALLMDRRAPDRLCTQLWELQCQTLIARFEGHHRLPGLLPVADDGWHTPFDRETWALAAIAIAEHVSEARLSDLDRGLAPWHDDDAREPLRKVIGQIWGFWVERDVSRRKANPGVLPWTVGAFAMGARLLARHGPMNRHDNDHGPPCLIMLPALLALHIRGEPAPAIGSWDLGSIPFTVLLTEAERQGVTEEVFLSSLWKLAGESNALAQILDNLLEHEGRQVELLWRSCPPDVLARRLQQRWNVSNVPWTILTDEQWIIAMEPLRQIGLHGEGAREVWHHLPWGVFDQLSRRGESWHTMYEASRVMWEREPEWMRSLAREVLPGNPTVSWLLWTMPFDTFLEELETWLHADGALALNVTSRLHAHVGRRELRWRDAWQWLLRLRGAPPPDAEQAAGRPCGHA